MVERFTTDPLELPPAEQPFERADLLIYGVDRRVESYEGRIFLNSPRVAKSADHGHPAYAGSYYVFGHPECVGDAGHCELPGERDTFDLRLPHHLEPGVEIVTVTEKVRELLEAGVAKAQVTVIGHVFATREPGKVVAFDRLRLTTYI
jgi:hypothetical protein